MSKNEIANIKLPTLDSREVARMVKKRHDHLLRDIEIYIKHLTPPNLGTLLENTGDGGQHKIEPSDFFIESTYTDSKGEMRPCYDVTRKGCEFIANKLTGQKGTLFAATFINRFHELEQGQCKIPTLPTDNKNKSLEIQEKNARTRIANAYIKIAANEALPKDYRGVFLAYASKELSGQDLLPLPESERKTYSATEIGNMFDLSSNKIGRLANEHNLKTPEYGMLYHDKSRHSVKEVDTFRYFDTVIPVLEEILGKKAGVVA